jgi:hypothetical protein
MRLKQTPSLPASCHLSLLTGHYGKCEPANISSFAADRQTHLEGDVLKELGVDDQVLKIC